MRHRQVWIGVLVVALLGAGQGLAAEGGCCKPPQDCFLKPFAAEGGCKPPQDCCFKHFGPVGGWSPYGGGLLHWWNPCCFPCAGAPDDYCRKPLPKVCWPAYPSYYIWGPPENCCPQGNGHLDCHKAH
jgi:hypothetical protein